MAGVGKGRAGGFCAGAGTASRREGCARKTGLRGRIAGCSVKTAFSLYAAGALVAAIVLSIVSTSVLGLIAESTIPVDPYVYTGTFLYDAESDALVPAEALSWYEEPADVAYADGSAQDVRTVVLYVESAADAGVLPIPLADPPAEARDGAVVDLAQTRGEGDREPLAFDQIAAHDARASASQPGREAAQALAAALPPNADGDRPVVSNVGYYIPYAGDPQPYRTIADIAICSVPVIFVVCFIVAGRLFYRARIARPVAAMDAASQRIAEGDLDFEMDPQRPDELGRLCGQFETMRAELARSEGALWQAAENRRRVNAAFAHDLRTPLTVMKGRAELIGMISDDERVRDAACAILRQADRLARYADGMSGLDSLEDLPLRPEPVSPGQLLDQAAEAARAAAPCGVDVKNAAEGLPPKVELDAAAFLRVADNLASNAARYAASRIEVRLSWEAGTLTLLIADDGPGFGVGAARAAEPFWREDKQGGGAHGADGTGANEATGDAGGHLGLGLYICRVLCAKQGGALALSDRPEGGACATATFSAPVYKGAAD